MKTARQAKVEMKRRGYTYRSAEPYVGRSYQWICDVLNGRKVSRPVIEAIYQLPIREQAPQTKRQTALST